MNIEDYKEHFRKLKEDPEYKREFLQKKEENTIKYWNELNPFVNENDVPTLPNPLTDFYINRLIELGAIPVDKLEDGVWYYGDYRNTTLGRWNAEDKKFGHWRWKFRWTWDTCNHFQNDNGYAVFVPLRKANEKELNEIKERAESILNSRIKRGELERLPHRCMVDCGCGCEGCIIVSQYK